MESTKKQYIDIELVKAFMKSRGIDKKELAKLMGVTLPTMTKFLNGANQSHISGEVIFKLAKAFNIPEHTLIHKDYR